MQTYLPEGLLSQTEENSRLLKNSNLLQEAMNAHKILEARAVICDGAHNLIVELGKGIRGFIPKEECAVGIHEGTTRDIAIISKVNKPICFYITDLKQDEDGNPYALLSRKQVQLDCQKDYISQLKPGDVIRAKVTHLEPFGCFVDIGCGIVSLIPIDAISVSRISHPRDRFQVGQDILAVVKGFDDTGKSVFPTKSCWAAGNKMQSIFLPEKPSPVLCGRLKAMVFL